MFPHFPLFLDKYVLFFRFQSLNENYKQTYIFSVQQYYIDLKQIFLSENKLLFFLACIQAAVKHGCMVRQFFSDVRSCLGVFSFLGRFWCKFHFFFFFWCKFHFFHPHLFLLHFYLKLSSANVRRVQTFSNFTSFTLENKLKLKLFCPFCIIEFAPQIHK